MGRRGGHLGPRAQSPMGGLACHEAISESITSLLGSLVCILVSW